MKTISTIANQQRLSTSQDVYWLLEIDWPDQTRGYATRPLSLGSMDYAPRLLHFERRFGSAAQDIPPRSLAKEKVVFRLADSSDVDEAFLALTRLYDPEGLDCRLSLFLQDADGEGGSDDVIEVFRGRIADAKMEGAEVEIEAFDFLHAASQRRIGRLLTSDLFPDLDPDWNGKMAPWIFGRVMGAELIPLNPGQTTRLSQAMDVSTSTVSVESLDGFASNGTIQVGGEVITYSAVDELAVSFGTAAAPVVRSVPTAHSTGTTVEQVPAGGFEFLVADHPCHSVANVKAGDTAISSGDYTLETEAIDGVTVQKIVFSQWPAPPYSLLAFSRLALRGETVDDIALTWAPGENNTASNSTNAVDGNSAGSAATISETDSLLSLGLKTDFSDGEKDYGAMTGVRLVARYSSDPLWDPATTVTLRAVKDGQNVELELSRPSLAQEVVSAELDASVLIGQGVGWDFFSESADWPRCEVEFDASGDSAEVEIIDLVWLADYQTNQETRLAGLLTATVEGRKVSGDLIDNPSDVIEFLLTDGQAADLENARIDSGAFASVRSALDAIGYRFGTRIEKCETAEALVVAALFESRTELTVSGDQLRLTMARREAEVGESVFDFDAGVVLDAGMANREPAPAKAFNDLSFLYSADFSLNSASAGRYGEEWREGLSEGVLPGWGRIEETIRCRWLADVETNVARDLAVTHLARKAPKRWIVAPVAPLRAIHLDPGDPVTIRPLGATTADPGRVTGWRMSALGRLAVEVAVEPAPWICWSHDSETFLQLRAGWTILEAWVAGSMVARLDLDGRLSIGGEVIEETLGTVSLDAEIEYDANDQRLYFGVEDGQFFDAAFGFDASGNLLLFGALVEDQPLESTEMDDWRMSGPTFFALGTGALSPALYYDAATGEARLRGRLQEGL